MGMVFTKVDDNDDDDDDLGLDPGLGTGGLVDDVDDDDDDDNDDDDDDDDDDDLGWRPGLGTGVWSSAPNSLQLRWSRLGVVPS